jgi:hypothetical protein
MHHARPTPAGAVAIARSMPAKVLSCAATPPNVRRHVHARPIEAAAKNSADAATLTGSIRPASRVIVSEARYSSSRSPLKEAWRNSPAVVKPR